MAKKESIAEKAETLLNPILEEFNFELWDVEYVKEGSDYYLRAYIDKEGGITIDDCVDVSRRFSDVLDADDFIEDAYILEVSSPGLGRQLKKDREFEKSVGKDVVVRTYKPIDGCKEFEGVLSAFDKDTITLDINGEKRVIGRTEASLIKLAVVFD